jgi:SAM-dependent methyltransferase
MKKEHIDDLLKQTIQDYNTISDDYTRTRAFLSDDVKEMVNYAEFGDMVLDSGCASGRLYNFLKEKGVEYFGIDISEKFIDAAKKTYPDGNFQVVDALSLPFTDKYFDKVLSVSVLHHIPSKQLQLQYMKEAFRVLKPGGLLILRVWDLWHQKEARKLILKYSLLKLIGRFKFGFKDIYIPWKDSQGNSIIQRYFHCFTKKDIEKLAIEAGFKINKIWLGGKDPRTNIYLVAEK